MCKSLLEFSELNYYGAFRRSAMSALWRHFNKTLLTWAMEKYKKLRRNKTKATKFLLEIKKTRPKLFAHWCAGMLGSFI
jgi:RNA-directed DNA polymerase